MGPASSSALIVLIRHKLKTQSSALINHEKKVGSAFASLPEPVKSFQNVKQAGFRKAFRAFSRLQHTTRKGKLTFGNTIVGALALLPLLRLHEMTRRQRFNGEPGDVLQPPHVVPTAFTGNSGNGLFLQ